jgi:hypothetical protein
LNEENQTQAIEEAGDLAEISAAEVPAGVETTEVEAGGLDGEASRPAATPPPEYLRILRDVAHLDPDSQIHTLVLSLAVLISAYGLTRAGRASLLKSVLKALKHKEKILPLSSLHPMHEQTKK